MRSSTRLTMSSWCLFKKVPELVLTLRQSQNGSRRTFQCVSIYCRLLAQFQLSLTACSRGSVQQGRQPYLLSTLFPVSLSITDDLTMVGLARLIMCSHSSCVRKL